MMKASLIMGMLLVLAGLAAASGKFDKLTEQFRENDATGTASAAHTHGQSDVTGLTAALGGKLATPATPSGYAVLYWSGAAWTTKGETTLAVDISSVTGGSTLPASVTAVESRALNLEINLGVTWAMALASSQGFYGGFSDPFTTDSLATKTGAYYNSSTDLYDTVTPGTSDLTSPGMTTYPADGGHESNPSATIDNNTGTYCANESVTVDLTSGYAVTSCEVRYLSNSPDSIIFYGSNNNTSWTQLHSTGTITWDTNPKTFTWDNSTAYRYVKYTKSLHGGAGSYVAEIQWFGATTADVTLVTSAWATDFAPASALWCALVQFVDTPTLGTDIKGYLSRDGSTWAEVTLTDGGLVGATYHIVYGEAAPGGTGNALYWKCTTHNSKQLRFKWCGVPASQE